MKVFHLSTYDFQGGAARAAFRLHTSLNKIGVDSNMYVTYRHSSDSKVIVHRQSNNLAYKIQLKINNYILHKKIRPYLCLRPKMSAAFSIDEVEFGSQVARQLPSCDIVHLHWISGFPQYKLMGLVDYNRFFRHLFPKRPIVWTLHDMNVFTGGCHYAGNCLKYTNICGACPELGSNNIRDLAFNVQRRKIRAMKLLNPRITRFIANSEWSAYAARQSKILDGFEIISISPGVDLEVFSPRNQNEARSVLGIPESAKVVAFGAAYNDPIKGFDLLQKALQYCTKYSELVCLSFGSGDISINLNCRHIKLGRIDEERLLSLIYSAADVFIIPSRYESFGQVALEAIACGVPVVGFKIGGIPEIVRPDVSGLLAEPYDSDELAAKIQDLLDNRDLRMQLSIKGRKMVENEFATGNKAEEYKRLYKSLLNDESAN